MEIAPDQGTPDPALSSPVVPPEAPAVMEGEVLDASGKTVYSPFGSASRRGRPHAGAQVRVYRGSWWLPVALGVGIPVLLVAGIFIFTVFLTVGILVFFLRSFLGFGKPLRTR